MGKIIINSAFWDLGRKDGLLRLCSHRKIGRLPKYEIVRTLGGGVVLDILSEDIREDKKILTFQPIGKGDAISDAMGFAERHETVHSKS
ncbi:MAG: hypothetical protein JO025_10845 [Verrucomicrobia bacterium]|nr:hypothetical protein [Verrucomicrobiota bacterium]